MGRPERPWSVGDLNLSRSMGICKPGLINQWNQAPGFQPVIVVFLAKVSFQKSVLS
jgi:hypothetical protein